ncbi:unnamed protein product [Microthlaspi erraticum]|uniref:Integrase catalytic domain-containing protein n=1 Tax=Microthlaspi erraticum TaxID=1685480 RepID=A0A6D2K9A3_9BRAS|nr:unnamed protein product [Microthlaspi erraticum]
MMTDIRRYVAECTVCQRNKYSTLTPGGLLQPLPVPIEIWEDISMDFVKGLPRSDGFNAILVVVDRLSKYAHFLGLKHPFTATDVALMFIREVVRLHGFPRTIVSDRDKVFTSNFWKELFRLAGTSLCLSTAYHPQTDGQTEVTNRGLETYLRCFTSDKPKAWAQFLSWAEFCYNTSFHSTINMSPFKAVYGGEPPPLLRFESGSTTNADLESRLIERDGMLELLREHMSNAQIVMKAKADDHRRVVEFAVARVGQVAYRLKLPAESKLHPTFHISQLKRVIGSAVEPSPLPPQLTHEVFLEATSEKILAVRTSPSSGQEEVLIQWKGLPEYDNSWEWKVSMKKRFPYFDLEDKVNFKEGSNVTYEDTRPPILYRYKRKEKGPKA